MELPTQDNAANEPVLSQSDKKEKNGNK